MIFFDWKKLYRESKKDPKRIILGLRVLNGEVPRNRFDPLYHFYIKDFSGQSFLVNLDTLLEETAYYKAKEIAEYVGLASFRNYSYYAMTGDATLDLLHSPVQQDTITNNRLLAIRDGRVHFLFERSH